MANPDRPRPELDAFLADLGATLGAAGYQTLAVDVTTPPDELPQMRIRKGRVMHRVERSHDGRVFRSLCRRSRCGLPQVYGPVSQWSMERLGYPNCMQCPEES